MKVEPRHDNIPCLMEKYRPESHCDGRETSARLDSVNFSNEFLWIAIFQRNRNHHLGESEYSTAPNLTNRSFLEYAQPLRSIRVPGLQGPARLRPFSSIRSFEPFSNRYGNCSGRLGSRCLASLNGLRFRIVAKAFRMRGNLNALEFARIVIFGVQVDLSSYQIRRIAVPTCRIEMPKRPEQLRFISILLLREKRNPFNAEPDDLSPIEPSSILRRTGCGIAAIRKREAG